VKEYQGWGGGITNVDGRNVQHCKQRLVIIKNNLELGKGRISVFFDRNPKGRD